MYQKLARYYDNPFRSAGTETRIRVALEELRAAGLTPPGPVVDLGCGTGLFALGLVAQGWQVIGIDNAPEMLAIAAANAADANAGAKLRLERADVRDFQPDRPAAAVLCVGDVVNHLLQPDDVQAMFRSAFRALCPGGLFLFDSHTLEVLKSRLWNSQVSSEVDSGALEAVAAFDEASGIARLDYRLSDTAEADAIVERYYPMDQLHGWLTDCGFQPVRVKPHNPTEVWRRLPKVRSLKHLWLAAKPPAGG